MLGARRWLLGKGGYIFKNGKKYAHIYRVHRGDPKVHSKPKPGKLKRHLFLLEIC